MSFEELVSNNLKLVHLVCKKYRNSGIEYDELYSIGCVGLVEACKRYDATRSALSTYAMAMINGHILRYLRDNTPIKFSRAQHDLFHEIRRCGLLDESCKTIAVTLGVPVKKVEAAMVLKDRHLISIFDNVGDLNLTYKDVIEDKSVDIETEIEEKIILEDFLNRLSGLGQDIALKFLEGKPQTRIAKELGISQATVSKKLIKIFNAERAGFEERRIASC